MSGELSGMVYDGPMTGNQWIVDEIAMINCAAEFLKFRRNRPLIVIRQGFAISFQRGDGRIRIFAFHS
ncbi:hypothetical protein WK35_20250 [Burkholderia vietnamiensis]|jgi:hypothetical protein|uniref:Uncharacterized protein n=1 Tax=Burkholderia vietnamiensis TaxID=60552 RepID=A0AA44XZH8_BURVI|nr:hypothetical protein WL96_18905 [Burkholderia vietnamiensis]AVR12073.1 hypothetical protein A8H33_00505 [Burkholderia vietnamiensis]KVE65795.1 hypothetical protein WI96_11420 [Burkholderia vietnamiensis]KVF12676.1 hypothetical protein WJ05_12920 [Burkholderia vietnamiensis]KVF36668.1 hypothetical protein WJ09_06730 [Burkholderia vietnamiensis]